LGATQYNANELTIFLTQFFTGNVLIKEAIFGYHTPGPNQLWRYHRLGIQSNTWYVEGISPADDAKTNWISTGPITGNSYSKAWRVGPSFVQVSDRREVIETDDMNNVEIAITAAKLNLISFNSLGFELLDLSSIKWKDDSHFTAVVRQEVPAKGDRSVNGTITKMGLLGPEEFTFERQDNPSRFYVTWKYDYQSRIPTRFETFVDLAGAGRTLIIEGHIFSITYGETDLKASDGYVPSLFQIANNLQRAYIYTNKNEYVVNADGSVEKIHRRAAANLVESDALHISWALLGGISVSSLILTVWWIKHRRI